MSMYVGTYVPTYVHTHTHTHSTHVVHTHTHACMHACMHACTHALYTFYSTHCFLPLLTCCEERDSGRPGASQSDEPTAPGLEARWLLFREMLSIVGTAMSAPTQ